MDLRDEITERENFPWYRRALPAITLYFLSPVIAELLMGSTPLSRANQLLFESILYGSGVLIIRETVHRLKWSIFSLFLLGIAFGITEECLMLQSAFNPYFLNHDLTFGRALGVNWVWSFTIIIYHAIWSITLPILLAEIIFRKQKPRTWLNKYGLILFSFLFVVAGIAFHNTFVEITGFSTDGRHFIFAGIAIAIIIWLAFSLREGFASIIAVPVPHPLVTSLIALVGSAGWFIILNLVFTRLPSVKPWQVLLAGLGLLLFLILLLSSFKKEKFTLQHTYSLIWGSLVSSSSFGLFVLMNQQDRMDALFQSLLFALVIIGLGLPFGALGKEHDRKKESADGSVPGILH